MAKHFFIINSSKYEIKEGNQILGRNPQNDIFIQEPSLSSRHLLISNFSKNIEIMDLNSSNGTKFKNYKLDPFDKAILSNNDEIELGLLKIIYCCEEEENNLDLESKNFGLENDSIRTDVTVLAKFDPKELLEANKKEKSDVKNLQSNNQRLSFLYAFGTRIGRIIDIKELFDYLLKELFKIFTASSRAIVFFNKNGVIKPSIFWENGHEKPISQAEYSKSILDLAINDKKGFIASDLGNDVDVSNSILMLNLQCTMICPFIINDELYGLLQIDSTKNINAFSSEDLKMFSGICNQIAVKLKNKQLINQMNKQNQIKDSLARYLGANMVQHLIENKINLDQKGEDRLVTVLFSDIRGFTRLSEKLKPTQIIEILSVYFSKMTDIIFTHDGFIDKFIGDAIFCIFGIPLFREDHIERAVKVAIKMQEELEILNQEIFNKTNIKLEIGIGINTGQVVYGNIASMEKPEVTILGDTVNIGERLCSIAKAGQILISSNSIKSLKKPYKNKKLGLVSLKGKEEKVVVHSIQYKEK